MEEGRKEGRKLNPSRRLLRKLSRNLLNRRSYDRIFHNHFYHVNRICWFLSYNNTLSRKRHTSQKIPLGLLGMDLFCLCVFV